jgi:hypothetical protein
MGHTHISDRDERSSGWIIQPDVCATAFRAASSDPKFDERSLHFKGYPPRRYWKQLHPRSTLPSRCRYFEGGLQAHVHVIEAGHAAAFRSGVHHGNGSTLAKVFRASSRTISLRARPEETSNAASRSISCRLPPRFAAERLRTRSSRILRMSVAETARKWARCRQST